MRKKRSKKTSKSYSFYNPLSLIKRIDTFNAMQRGEEIKPNTPLALDPKTLTYTQQILVIEYQKYSEVMSNVEIADFLKLHRETIANRLKDIDKENDDELEKRGMSVWSVVGELRRACGYVKQRARVLNKPELYWKATLDFIDQCQKLGVIHEKPIAVDVFTYPQHSEEDERTIIRYYQDEQRRTTALLKAREDKAKAEVVKLIPADKKG